MLTLTILASCLLLQGPAPKPAPDRPGVLVVVGAAGTPEYGAEFRRWGTLWREAASKARVEFRAIGEDASREKSDRERLREALAATSAAGNEPLWVILIGHGTFDGKEARFNLRGPDVSDAELLDWIKAIRRPLAVVDCTSASGPFLARLSGPDRVIVTATRSGDEQSFARLGQYLAEAVGDAATDLDKDGQVSLLETFLVASGRVAEFYKTRSRLATEHPLIDDNGDRLGTPADWFRGIHATKRAKDGAEPDGIRAHQLHLIPSDRERRLSPAQREQRDQLERSAALLRARKAQLPEEEYYRRLEALMLELAGLYRATSSPPAATP